MKFKILLSISFWILLLIVSCSRDELSFDSPSQKLRFSEDTVFCDTVYHQVRSETYAVKVYNTEDKDVKIPKISLEKGAASLYRINVDGQSGTVFNNVPLRKKDSLYIFVEIAPTATGTEALAEDRVVFESPAATQHVTLLSVVQDAEFFIQTGQNPVLLSSDTNWNNAKAKIIYGDLKLAEGKTLNIAQGTKVYFHKNSGLTISKNSSLKVNGDLQNEVVFRGDRNDTKYDTLPKSWNGIKFEENANLQMNYARVFGGSTGLEFYKANANIKNTVVHTFQDFGILGISANITAENLVMNNCGQASIGIFRGGTYNFTHSTIANYWDLNSSLPAHCIYATNEFINATGQTENAALQFNFKNSIAYGKSNNAIFFKPISGQTFSYLLDSSLIKFASGNGYNWDGNSSVVNSIQNQDPKFKNFYTQYMFLKPKDDSPAKNKAKATTAATVPLDILKINRTISPTIGAYQ